ncbi:MAG: Fe-S cluster assembly protein SufD [Verrucomicrobiales bacterium]|nr:Fe-S cluster assembly protein SufD [Verrucomicrobiales bacterium]
MSAHGEWVSEPLRRDVGAELPDWYQQIQADSWHNFLETPEPVRKDENWRFADLKKIRFERINPVGSLNEQGSFVERFRSNRVDSAIGHCLFANGHLIESDFSQLPDDVIACEINEALANHSELVKEHFMQDPARLGSQKFAALHGASTLCGVFIHVPKNVVIDGVIEIHHVNSGENTGIFPHTLIVAEANSKVSVFENFETAGKGDSPITVGMVDLDARDGGKIQYASFQNNGPNARHMQINASRVGRDSAVKNCFVNLGSMWVRNEAVSRMMEPGADSQMFSANLANGTEEYDQRTLQLHEAQHTTSDLLYKNALYDDARTIFSGLIQVGKGAHHTDSYQTCRNMLGSDTAEANAMPGLEIDADQVKCSHGSTSGPISEEEIFYLMARGIPAERARRMISLGFLNEVIQRLEGDDVKEFIFGKVEAKFRAI